MRNPVFYFFFEKKEKPVNKAVSQKFRLIDSIAFDTLFILKSWLIIKILKLLNKLL